MRDISERVLAFAAIIVLAAAVGIGLVALHRSNGVDLNRSAELLFSTSRTMDDFDRLRFIAKQVQLSDPALGEGALDRAFAMSRSRISNFQNGELSRLSDQKLGEAVRRVIAKFDDLEAIMAAAACDDPCRAGQLLQPIGRIKRELARMQGRALVVDAQVRGQVAASHEELIEKLLQLVALIVLFFALLLAYTLRKNAALQGQADTLRESRRRIHEISEYRAQFLAGMSHEFRTPINAIKGFSQLILFQGAAIRREKIDEYLRDIEASARDLEQLTDRILDLAKIDAGSFELRESAVDLSELIDNVARQFTAAQDLAPDRLVVSLDHSLILRCDENAVKRCLQNLISNALKFSEPETPVNVDVKVDTDALRIVVSDRGCGIPADELSAVWGDYVRSSYTRRSDRQGTGLGLPIVKALIRAHGGLSYLESAEGRGTKVTITMPRLRVMCNGRGEVLAA